MNVHAYGALELPPATPAPGAPATAPREPRKTVGYKLVLLIWLVYMFEPQTYMANTLNLPIIARVLLILICLLAVTILIRPPRKILLVPYGVIVVYLFLISPFALNTGYARFPAVQAALFFVVAVGLGTFVRTPKQVLPLLAVFMIWQFLWWAPWGLLKGLIWWHGEYSNPDGYGPLMGFGIAAAFPYAVAVKDKRVKWIAFCIGVACVLGLASSFARGAFLAGVAVLGWMWLNAPRKGVATGFLLAAAIGLVVANRVFTGEGRGTENTNLFDEMATIFSKGELADDGGREALRDMAVEVWKARPFMGVGGRNFGVYAAEYLGPDKARGDFQSQPGRLYDAALHNSFLQVLSEYGLIGSFLYLWLLADFFRRNLRLRSAAFRTAWEARGGGAVDLKWVSVGLTGMMISVLCNGLFYNVLHWILLPAVLAMNALVYKVADPGLGPTDSYSLPVRLSTRGSL